MEMLLQPRRNCWRVLFGTLSIHWIQRQPKLVDRVLIGEIDRDTMDAPTQCSCNMWEPQSEHMIALKPFHEMIFDVAIMLGVGRYLESIRSLTRNQNALP